MAVEEVDEGRDERADVDGQSAFDERVLRGVVVADDEELRVRVDLLDLLDDRVEVRHVLAVEADEQGGDLRHVCGIVDQFISVAQHIAPEGQREVQVLTLDVVEDAGGDGQVVDADAEGDDVGLFDVVVVLLADFREAGGVDRAVVVRGRDSPTDGDVAGVVLTEEVAEVVGAEADVGVLVDLVRADGLSDILRVGAVDDGPGGFPLGVFHEAGQGIACGDGVTQYGIDDFAVFVDVVLRVRFRFLCCEGED